jgi:hypothetical protein
MPGDEKMKSVLMCIPLLIILFSGAYAADHNQNFASLSDVVHDESLTDEPDNPFINCQGNCVRSKKTNKASNKSINKSEVIQPSTTRHFIVGRPPSSSAQTKQVPIQTAVDNSKNYQGSVDHSSKPGVPSHNLNSRPAR